MAIRLEPPRANNHNRERSIFRQFLTMHAHHSLQHPTNRIQSALRRALFLQRSLRLGVVGRLANEGNLHLDLAVAKVVNWVAFGWNRQMIRHPVESSPGRPGLIMLARGIAQLAATLRDLNAGSPGR